MPLLILPLVALGNGGVEDIQGLPGYQHIKTGALLVEGVTSSSITMVSLTCLCNKFTLGIVLVAACPLHPLTGQSRGSSVLENDIRYV